MISPIKIILLLAVIGAVFFAARFFKKSLTEGGEKSKEGSASGKSHTDLVKCPECETYVSSLDEHICKN
ncbi:MAG: hypothetical protein V7750_14825 [Sneathiella sp.]